MNYIELTLIPQDKKHIELIIAHLADFEINGFNEEEDRLIAYIEDEKWTKELGEVLDKLSLEFNTRIEKSSLKNQNWNAQWESDYEPVLVDDFCAIRASFHPPISSVKHDIVVTPKMSFGTGHHATTYMMMKQMEQLNFDSKSVFDYGCGTGVLAILAHKLGARDIEAVDIDKWAYENTKENLDINTCADEITTYCGELDIVPKREYDIILANINRNVILNTMEDMAARLKKGGVLLCSGFLEEDIPLVIEEARKYGLENKAKLSREKWRCLKF